MPSGCLDVWWVPQRVVCVCRQVTVAPLFPHTQDQEREQESLDSEEVMTAADCDL